MLHTLGGGGGEELLSLKLKRTLYPSVSQYIEPCRRTYVLDISNFNTKFGIPNYLLYPYMHTIASDF